MIKIGINGFGRIGRLVFRAAVAQPDKYGSGGRERSVHGTGIIWCTT